MKKILIIAAVFAGVASSFAQGTLTFNNSGTTLISVGAGGPAPAGPTAPALGGYIYGLFTAPVNADVNSGATDSSWQTIQVYATNTAAVTGGRLSGGQQPTTLAPGSTANILVRGWSSNLGSTWAEVLNWYNTQRGVSVAGYFGESAVGLDAILNASPSPINGVFGTSGGALVPGFTLSYYPVVPEPSSMALAGLGAASLLLFRRRK